MATAHGLFSTGLHLPHGATIKKVTVLYRSGSFSTPCFTLIRTRLSDGSGETVASGSLADNSNRRTAEAIVVPPERALVDNRTYAYGIGLCLGGSGGDAFYSARITYTHAP